jgi:hypothetical protein
MPATQSPPEVLLERLVDAVRGLMRPKPYGVFAATGWHTVCYLARTS